MVTGPYAEKILELVEVKHQAGAVSSLDLVQARQTVASQRAELTQLLRQRTEARKAEELAEVRYRAGATPLQSWLDTQESRRSTKKSLAQNRLNRLNSQMMLFQALGGGMNKRDRKWASPVVIEADARPGRLRFPDLNPEVSPE
jgi:outer membrane protein TolC